MRTIFALCAVFVTPFAIPLNNESGREMVLIPDGEGQLHYVDLKMAQREADAEPFFSGEADMRFLLFTRSNPTTPHILQIGNPLTVDNSHFNPNHPTRVTIHGWNAKADSSVNTLVRNAYLEQGDFNVIFVDWSIGAVTGNYVTACNRVAVAGEVTARLLLWLSIHGLRFEDVYLIGHSLGAHIAGMAGKLIPARNIDTIFGLDPALPLFSIGKPAQRLDATDATYVEVLHTNAGVLGFDLQIGDTGFYPNGGRIQPGCGIDITFSCAHGRAIDLLAESIIKSARRFVGTQCASFNEIKNNVCTPSGPNRDMGGEPSNRANVARGVFFLATNGASPFARN